MIYNISNKTRKEVTKMKKITNKQKEALKEVLLTKQGSVRVNAITELSGKQEYRVNIKTGTGRNTRVREDDYIECLREVCNILGIKYQLNNDAPRGGQMGDYITLPIRKDINLLELIGYVAPKPVKVEEVKKEVLNCKPANHWSMSEILAELHVTMTQVEKEDFANYLKSITSYKKIQLDGDDHSYNVYHMSPWVFTSIMLYL